MKISLALLLLSLVTLSYAADRAEKYAHDMCNRENYHRYHEGAPPLNDWERKDIWQRCYQEIAAHDEAARRQAYQHSQSRRHYDGGYGWESSSTLGTSAGWHNNEPYYEDRAYSSLYTNPACSPYNDQPLFYYHAPSRGSAPYSRPNFDLRPSYPVPQEEYCSNPRSHKSHSRKQSLISISSDSTLVQPTLDRKVQSAQQRHMKEQGHSSFSSRRHRAQSFSASDIPRDHSSSPTQIQYMELKSEKRRSAIASPITLPSFDFSVDLDIERKRSLIVGQDRSRSRVQVSYGSLTLSEDKSGRWIAKGYIEVLSVKDTRLNLRQAIKEHLQGKNIFDLGGRAFSPGKTTEEERANWKENRSYMIASPSVEDDKWEICVAAETAENEYIKGRPLTGNLRSDSHTGDDNIAQDDERAIIAKQSKAPTAFDRLRAVLKFPTSKKPHLVYEHPTLGFMTKDERNLWKNRGYAIRRTSFDFSDFLHLAPESLLLYPSRTGTNERCAFGHHMLHREGTFPDIKQQNPLVTIPGHFILGVDGLDRTRVVSDLDDTLIKTNILRGSKAIKVNYWRRRTETQGASMWLRALQEPDGFNVARSKILSSKIADLHNIILSPTDLTPDDITYATNSRGLPVSSIQGPTRKVIRPLSDGKKVSLALSARVSPRHTPSPLTYPLSLPKAWIDVVSAGTVAMGPRMAYTLQDLGFPRMGLHMNPIFMNNLFRDFFDVRAAKDPEDYKHRWFKRIFATTPSSMKILIEDMGQVGPKIIINYFARAWNEAKEADPHLDPIHFPYRLFLRFAWPVDKWNMRIPSAEWNGHEKTRLNITEIHRLATEAEIPQECIHVFDDWYEEMILPGYGEDAEMRLPGIRWDSREKHLKDREAAFAKMGILKGASPQGMIRRRLTRSKSLSTARSSLLDSPRSVKV